MRARLSPRPRAKGTFVRSNHLGVVCPPPQLSPRDESMHAGKEGRGGRGGGGRRKEGGTPPPPPLPTGKKNKHKGKTDGGFDFMR
jgi:hypothetical protein